MEDNECEAKAQLIKSKEIFENQACWVLNQLEEFKKIEKKMKQYEANIKAYMVDNNIDTFKSKQGSFTIITKKVSLLDKNKIEDIEKYYVEQKRVIMYKSIN